MRKGFTLAEVLITLGIIGVVAALTLPSLIQNHKDKETVTKLKKTYSIMSQALLMGVNENGSVKTWGFKDSSMEEHKISATTFFNNLSPYLKIVKDCNVDEEGCFLNIKYKLFDGNDSLNFVIDPSKYKFILADGSLMAVYGYPMQPGGDQGGIYIDVNGTKGPNQFGVDLFQFVVKNDSLVPGEVINDSKESFERCLTFGYSCAAWVITNENLDYKKCPDKLLAGATKCK